MIDIKIEKGANKKKLKSDFWWQREGLTYIGNVLHFENKPVEELIHSTPSYVYSKQRILENIDRLSQALIGKNLKHSIHYAMKANRHPSVLKTILNSQKVGVDVCSPNELKLALDIGFAPNQINYTGTSISKYDYAQIALCKGIRFNADSLSVIRQIGTQNIFDTIGIRINPQIGLGYNESLEYAGNNVTKFGIYSDQIQKAFELAKNYNIEIDTIHFHVGSGYLNDQLPKMELLLENLKDLIKTYDIKRLNIGGGLGVPQQKDDVPLDLDKWSSIISNFVHFQCANPDLEIVLEPGDYFVKDAGILVGEVTYQEEKNGIDFLGVNLGMNINYEYAYYKMNLEAVPLTNNTHKLPQKSYTIAGNINEPIDLLGQEVILPLMQEGDLIAFLNTGGYGASTASNHCMRGDFSEIII